MVDGEVLCVVVDGKVLCVVVDGEVLCSGRFTTAHINWETVIPFEVVLSLRWF